MHPSQPPQISLGSDRLFEGPGEMRALCRAFDWSATALGPTIQWSHSLRSVVSTVLASRHPMFVFWGPQLIQFYNDAYRPSLAGGGRHPRALGAPGAMFWTEIWHIIEPQIAEVMATGAATWHVDQLVPIERNGGIEEVYWTYSYSPILDDDGAIGGTLVVCQETTDSVVTARRMRTLHRIATAAPRSAGDDGSALTTELVEADHHDVPFAICFINESLSDAVDSATVETATRLVSVKALPADSPLTDPARWPLAEAIRTREPQLVTLSAEEALPGVSPWPEPITSAAVLPLRSASGAALGALVLGLSPRLPWNPRYEDFARAVARDIAAHIAARRDLLDRQQLVSALVVERARLGYVFRHAPTFLAVLRGPDHVFEMVNDSYHQLLGLRDVVGKPVLEAIPEIRDQGFKELLDRVLETGRPFFGREMPATIADRTGGLKEVFMDLSYLPFYELDGARSGIIAHGTDVTAQVTSRRERDQLLLLSEQARDEAEAARRDAELAREEAEAANRAKGEFLAVMSHELRTPLNAIGGYTELIEMGIRGPVTDQQREDLGRIHSSQQHLLGLINEVLNYARIETGSIRYDIAEVSLREALIAAEGLVRPQVNAKNLTLDIAEPPRDFTLRADADKLRQILVNLLSNATKFTDRRGRISLAWERVGTEVLITVSDTGHGIPADKLEVIFDPFVQVRADLTRTPEGTGLGLAISRDLARGMDGDLKVQSEVGKGSTFTLRLPASE